MEDVHDGLYARLLQEAPGRAPANPMIAFYVEKDARSLGCAYRFASLKRKHPKEHERLVLEKRGQGKLF